MRTHLAIADVIHKGKSKLVIGICGYKVGKKAGTLDIKKVTCARCLQRCK